MFFKQALFATILAAPLVVAASAPSAADTDFGVSFGLGDPYYGYDRGLYADRFLYDDDIYLRAPAFDEEVSDDPIYEEGLVIEPNAAPAEPAPCIKTNVTNLANACPN